MTSRDHDSERTEEAQQDAAARVPVAGDRIGKYTVLEPLGEGAMGVVLRAYDSALDREVAIKVVRPRASVGAEALELARGRLVAEARALARISHPNVVGVYEVGLHGALLYVAMEFVRGVDLQRWLREGDRPWREVLEVFLAVGRGLECVHAAGLVHRDVKPANILVGADGRARIGDFGIARASVELAPPLLDGHGIEGHDLARTAVTAEGHVVGTPAYMAPEQHAAGEAGPAADQFAFCVALVEALWGERPYRVEARRMLAAKRAGPRPPSTTRRVPAHLWPIVARGLAPDPAARFPSMAALCDALARDPERARRRWRRAAMLALAGAGALVFAVTRPGPCDDAERALDGVWDRPRRAALADAFAGSPHPWAQQAWTHASARLDDWSGQWLAMHRQTCELGRTADPLLDRRHACLQARRRGLVAVTEALDGAPASTVEHTFELLGQLRPVAPCGDPVALASAIELPDDPEVRARVEDVRAELARGRAMIDAGRYRDAIVLGEGLVVEARALEHPPLIAEALTFAGTAHQRVGEEPQARAVLEEAVWLALELGHDEAASEAAIALLWNAGRQAVTIDEALRWGELARAELARRPDAPRIDLVQLEHGIGAAQNTAARYDDALHAYARALAIVGDDPNLVVVEGTIHASIAKLHQDRGQVARARAELEPTIARLEPILGHDHPHLSRMRGLLAMIFDAAGEYERAVEMFTAVVEGLRLAMGDDAPRVAYARINLAVALDHAGRDDEALAMTERALASLEAGGDSLGTATAIGNLGLDYFERGIHDAAEQKFERALAMIGRLYPPDHPEQVVAIIGLGRVRITQGRYDAAIALFDRAEAIVRAAHGPDARLRALALEGRGKAEAAAGRLDAAEATLLEQVEILRRAPDAAPTDVADALRDLAKLRRQQGRPAEAAALEAEAGPAPP
ncbi:MAG: serine/threonine protein kinase [Myxococcales bacterium]|nr:serine/threonine protein kinase [Myxococcales bacterium]